MTKKYNRNYQVVLDNECHKRYGTPATVHYTCLICNERCEENLEARVKYMDLNTDRFSTCKATCHNCEDTHDISFRVNVSVEVLGE